MNTNKHIMLFYYSLFFIAFLLYSFPVLAQQPPPDLFVQKQFADYLTDLQTKFPRAVEIDTNVKVAIALEATKSWDTDQGKEIRKQLGDTSEKSTLASIRFLLGGDITGAVELFPSNREAPDTNYAIRAVKALRDNGYTLQADAVLALTRDLSQRRIIAWISIPADKRKPIDDNMLLRYDPSDLNRRALVDIAWQLYIKPPPEAKEIPADAFYDFAVWLGRDSGQNTLAQVAKLYYDGKPAGAVKLALLLAKESPDDARLQQSVAGWLLQANDRPGAAAFIKDRLATGREPFVREIRLDYFELLQAKRLTPENEALVTYQLGENAVAAGDALLVEEKYPEATAKYLAVLQDEKAEIGRRAGAWGGLLDSDPAVAFQQADGLLTAVGAVPDVAQRAKLVEWLGARLGRAVDRVIPIKPGQMRMATRLAFTPVQGVDGWEGKLAAVMDRLLALDPVAVLSPGPRNLPSLRYTAAVIYSLAGDAKKADEISRREITYLQPPPAGGWAIAPGVPDKDPFKPREWKSPRPNETATVMAEVTAAMSRYQKRVAKANPTAPIETAPPNTELIAGLAAQLKATKNPDEAARLMRQLGEQLALAVAFLDPLPANLRLDQPPPPPRPLKMELFLPLQSSITLALENDLAAKNALPLLQQGLQPSMLTASNPDLLQALLTLTLDTLARFLQAHPDKAMVHIAANSVANHLEGRRVYDMKPYADKIRERYPRPK